MKTLSFVLPMLLLSGTAHAAADDPTEIVETVTEEAQDSLVDKKLTSAETERLLEDVDVDGIARFALGKYAKSFSDAEYNAYEAAFRTYLRGQMEEHLAQFSSSEVDIVDETQRGSQTIIETKVTRADGEVMNVNWRLRRSSAGWEIIDVEAMNLWLAIEQRAQFLAELDQNGGDLGALVQTIKAKS
ncbi:MAG: ABC transporter substrate-binding protein [Pseudomonadota bacterium]